MLLVYKWVTNLVFIGIVLFLGIKLTRSEELKDCGKLKSYVVEETQRSIVPFQVRRMRWCMRFPPRCSEYYIENKEIITVRNVTRYKINCCDGYREIKLSDDVGCEPICIEKCLNGHCVAPNRCVCTKGFKANINGICVPIISLTNSTILKMLQPMNGENKAWIKVNSNGKLSVRNCGKDKDCLSRNKSSEAVESFTLMPNVQSIINGNQLKFTTIKTSDDMENVTAYESSTPINNIHLDVKIHSNDEKVVIMHQPQISLYPQKSDNNSNYLGPIGNGTHQWVIDEDIYIIQSNSSHNHNHNNETVNSEAMMKIQRTSVMIFLLFFGIICICLAYSYGYLKEHCSQYKFNISERNKVIHYTNNVQPISQKPLPDIPPFTHGIPIQPSADYYDRPRDSVSLSPSRSTSIFSTRSSRSRNPSFEHIYAELNYAELKSKR